MTHAHTATPAAGPWLAQQWETRWEQLGPDQRLQLFLAAWLDGQRQPAPAPPPLHERIASALYAPDSPLRGRAGQASPELQALALHALRQDGRPLADLLAPARDLAAALVGLISGEGDRSPRVHLLARRLQGLDGLAQRWPEQAPALPFDLDDLYDAPDPAISALCDYIAVQTDFGQRPDALPRPQRAICGEALPAVGLTYLRDARLDLGCDVLRSLQYLGLGTLVADQALPFLRIQQQPAGLFGRLSLGARQRLEQRQANIDDEVYLPSTLTCLWTLALYEQSGDPFARGRPVGCGVGA